MEIRLIFKLRINISSSSFSYTIHLDAMKIVVDFPLCID